MQIETLRSIKTDRVCGNRSGVDSQKERKNQPYLEKPGPVGSFALPVSRRNGDLVALQDDHELLHAILLSGVDVVLVDLTDQVLLVVDTVGGKERMRTTEPGAVMREGRFRSCDCSCVTNLS